MSGHVFHPGHHHLHGITVVVETTGTTTVVGRFDTEDQQGVHLVNVSLHDAASDPLPLAEFLRRTAEYGVRVDRRHLLLAGSEVRRVTPLGQLVS